MLSSTDEQPFPRTYQEGCTCPGEGGGCVEVGRPLEDGQLCIPDSEDLLLEGGLPGVQLEDLHAVEDLVHQLDTRVLLHHALHLVTKICKLVNLHTSELTYTAVYPIHLNGINSYRHRMRQALHIHVEKIKN